MCLLLATSVVPGGISVSSGQTPEVGTQPELDLVSRVQGKAYERFDFGNDGTLMRHHVLRFGKMAPAEDVCTLPIEVISYDVDQGNEVIGESELVIFVECANPHLVVDILTFVGTSGVQELQAKVTGDALVYPTAPTDGAALPDLHYTLKVKRGVLSLLGTKAHLVVTGRTVVVPNPGSAPAPQDQEYEIHSDITVSVSVLGVRLQTRGFTSRLVLAPGFGVVEEILHHDNGARTVIHVLSTPRQ